MTLDNALACVDAWNPGQAFMLTGQSRTGCNHVVIAQSGAIIHDPSLDDSGIVGCCDDGLWWVSFLGSLLT